MLSKLITILAVILLTATITHADIIDKLLEEMVVEEQITLDDRYTQLREVFLDRLVEELSKKEDSDFTDSGTDEMEEAADIYIDDLREREQQ